MLRRKREQQKEFDEEQAKVMARIEERREKIKQGNKDEGITEAQKEELMKNLSKQLESLTNAYDVEKRRQALAMNQKLAARKEKIVKANKLKQQLEKQEAAQA